MDSNPQSGGSNGKVYSVDAPGIGPSLADGNTYRARLNFFAWGELPDVTAVSPNYSFYLRVSCQKTANGFVFINDVPGDNQIGVGSTPTTWNLQ
jgi:hypothetical protein